MGLGTRLPRCIIFRQITYYDPYLKAESENQMGAKAVLKILLAPHEDVKIIA